MYINLSAGAIGVKANLTETLDLAQRHAFTGIDIPIAEVADLVDAQGVDAIKSRFDKAGIQPGAWGFPVNFRGDDAMWRADLEKLPRYARAAQQLGFDRITTFLMPTHDELTYSANFDLHVTRIKPGAQILADHGIRLGLEWVGPKTLRHSKKHHFIHTLDGALALGAAIGTDNMGLLVDSWHIYTARAWNDDIRQLSAEQVVAVHVNDAPIGVPVDEQVDQVRDLPTATGVIDLTGFLHALRDIGYDGPVTAEPFSQRIRDLPANEAVAETSSTMHKMWQAASL